MKEHHNILLYRLQNLNGSRQYISFDSIALAFHDPVRDGDFEQFKKDNRSMVLEQFIKLCKKHAIHCEEYHKPPHMGDFCIFRKNIHSSAVN